MSTPSLHPARFAGPPFLRLDLPRGAAQPSAWRWIIASAIAVGASLLACLGLAQLAELANPNLAGYEHFQFADYSRLTIVGVLIACIGWPIVCWFTSTARRLYLWLAIVVTIASFAPDVWILRQGQPELGVLTLVVMHVALALVTFPAMVFISPQRTRGAHRG